jgi:hypothetical protein
LQPPPNQAAAAGQPVSPHLNPDLRRGELS